MVRPSRLGREIGGNLSPTRGVVIAIDVMGRETSSRSDSRRRWFGLPVLGRKWLGGGFQEPESCTNDRPLHVRRTGGAQILAAFMRSKQHTRRHHQTCRATVSGKLNRGNARTLERASDQSAGLVG